MPFYESLRTALSRYAAFVHTAASPASPAELRAASARLLWPLPPSYIDFLSSWNGVTLFHDALILHPASALRPTGPADRFVCIGEAFDGELWLDKSGRLRLISEVAPDPMVCGSDIEHWLDATLGRETLIFDREGEFRDVFEEDGEALSSAVRRKRAQVGARQDPDAALYPYELAELLCEESDLDGARQLLQKAVALDSEAGPAWELLSGLLQKLGRCRRPSMRRCKPLRRRGTPTCARPGCSMPQSLCLSVPRTMPPPPLPPTRSTAKSSSGRRASCLSRTATKSRHSVW